MKSIDNRYTWLKQSITILDRCPSRPVAWHHKGLAYRELWKREIKMDSSSQDLSMPVSPVAKCSTASGTDKFIIKAKECFEKAIDLTEQPCCRYLTDLAKACASLCQFDDADRIFAQANGLAFTSGTVDDDDAFYLYEQWAQYKATEQYCVLYDVIAVHHKALRFSLLANMRTRDDMAFKLLDMLKEQPSDVDEVIELECDLLGTALHMYSRLTRRLLEALRNDRQTLARAWKLVELFLHRRKEHDAYAAYLYLTAIMKSGCMDSSDKGKRKLILDVTKNVYEDEADQASFNSAMRDAFRWLIDCMLEADEEHDQQHNPDEDMEVCVLAKSDGSSGLEAVVKLLRCHLGLAVARCVMTDNSETNNVEELLKYSKSVVVIEELTTEWLNRSPIVEVLCARPPATVCVVTMNSQGIAPINVCTNSRWTHALLVPDSQYLMAYSLMKQWLL
jgi:hypothetical protein